MLQTGAQPYTRVLEFKNDKGEFIFEFSPNTEDDIRSTSWIIYIIIKRISSGIINPDMIEEFYQDFMREIMFYRVNDKTSLLSDLAIRFYINYNGGTGAPKVTIRRYEDRVEYQDEFTIINFQAKRESLSYAFKTRTDVGAYRSSFIIYFILLQFGKYASVDYTTDLWVTFMDVLKEVQVTKPDQNIGNTIFTYMLDYNDRSGKPEIKAREE